jgi:putative FmdB family regulatory protein
MEKHLKNASKRLSNKTCLPAGRGLGVNVMPNYDYECSACGHAFEEFQTMTDAKLSKCPKCGKNKLARLIGGGSGMIFKGTGFYQTDYKNKPAPTATPAPKTDTKASGASCGGGCACHPS